MPARGAGDQCGTHARQPRAPPDDLGSACASLPGTSTPSAPASTASRPACSVRTSTCSRCRRPSARTTSSPRTGSTALGYEVAHHGLVAVERRRASISRVGLDDVQVGFEGMPHCGDPLASEARALGGTCGGVRVWSLYVPNGRALGDPHMDYKLEWLERLRATAGSWARGGPVRGRSRSSVTGTSPRRTRTSGTWPSSRARPTCPPPSARRSRRCVDAGFTDVVRPHTPGPGTYTYWDYTQLRFPKRQGMRIDFVLGSPALATRVDGARPSTARSARARAPATTPR